MPHPAPGAPLRPRLLALAWPMLVELGLAIAMGLVGTALAGRISDRAGAAFALANHVSAALFILFRLVGAGVGVVVTQRLGGRQRAAADAAARAAVGASSWLGGGVGLLALLGAPTVLGWMNAPADVLPLSAALLRQLAPALMLDAWNASMASVMRAHLRVRDTLVVMALMQALQLALALPLMHGAGPVPALGLAGFAVALCASRLLALVLHLMLWRSRLSLQLQAHDWWRVPAAQLRAILHIGLPGAGENIAYRVAFTASVAAVGTMGTRALAAQAYVLQIGACALMFSLAIGLAVELLVGHLVGAGRLHEAHRLVRRSLARGLAVGVAVATALALTGPWLLRLFTRDQAIVAAGSALLWWGVLVEPGRTFNLVVINALRATGDARYPVMAGAVSMLLVLAGGSWWLGVHWQLGLTGVWIAYAADEWLRGLLMWRRWARHRWVPHARARRRRLRRPAPLAPAAAGTARSGR